MKQLGKLAALSVSVMAMAIMLVPANASAYLAPKPSWLYRSGGRSIPGYGAPTTQAKVRYWYSSDTKFWMRCWTSHQYYTGNYGSSKWFWGQDSSGRSSYVHASYVYYQQSVPRC